MVEALEERLGQETTGQGWKKKLYQQIKALPEKARELPRKARKTFTLENLYDNFSKPYWVDTAVGQAFWTPVMVASDTYLPPLLGQEPLTNDQIWMARLIGIPLGMATVRPITKIRDAYQAKAMGQGMLQSSWAEETGRDLKRLGLPIAIGYAGHLALVADDPKKIAATAVVGSLAQILSGVGFLEVLKRARRFAGTAPAYQEEHARLPKLLDGKRHP